MYQEMFFPAHFQMKYKGPQDSLNIGLCLRLYKYQNNLSIEKSFPVWTSQTSHMLSFQEESINLSYHFKAITPVI